MVIPSFAVGRAQQLLYYLRELKQSSLIPDLPVIVDSPMAADATALYAESVADYDEQALEIVRSGKKPFHVSKLGFTRGREDSIRLNAIKEPMIIISASGMLTGGRILHHLKHRVSDQRNTILFVGHQPNGSKGARLLQGTPRISILGDDCPVHARIEAIGALSAHGDQGELLRWLHSCSGTPSTIAVVHGEPHTAQVFAKKLRDEQHAEVIVPTYRQQIEI
jgi:metallo-beta-lactamase family protein